MISVRSNNRLRIDRILLSILLLVFFLESCGKIGDPVPPRMDHPQQIACNTMGKEWGLNLCRNKTEKGMNHELFPLR